MADMPPPELPPHLAARMPRQSPRLWTFRYTWKVVRDTRSALAVGEGYEPVVVCRSGLTIDAVDQWSGDAAAACRAIEDDLTVMLAGVAPISRRWLRMRVVVDGGYVDG